MSLVWLLSGFVIGCYGASVGHDKEPGSLKVKEAFVAIILMLAGMGFLVFGAYEASEPLCNFLYQSCKQDRTK